MTKTVRGRAIETLFSQADIARENLRIAEEISHRNQDNLLVIAILKGSFVFAADLIRAMHEKGLEPEVEFLSLSSYGAGTESGEVRILRDVESDVEGRNVLLIDDILESGNTLKFAADLMNERKANRVEIAVLLDKQSRRKAAIDADYTGFVCPDYFVVGYGMDVGHAFRELPFVGVVQDSTD
ncbi:MAG: hypoxanthine phosphoribosyltransferase [Pseudomonadota bacterium]